MFAAILDQSYDIYLRQMFLEAIIYTVYLLCHTLECKAMIRQCQINKMLMYMGVLGVFGESRDRKCTILWLKIW